MSITKGNLKTTISTLEELREEALSGVETRDFGMWLVGDFDRVIYIVKAILKRK